MVPEKMIFFLYFVSIFFKFGCHGYQANYTICINKFPVVDRRVLQKHFCKSFVKISAVT